MDIKKKDNISKIKEIANIKENISKIYTKVKENYSPEFSTIIEEIKKAKDNINILENKYLSKEDELNRIQKYFQKLENDIKSKKKEIDKLNNQLKEIDSKNKELQNLVKLLDNEKCDLTKKLIEEQLKMKESENKNKNIFDNLNNQINQLKNELKNKSDNYERMISGFEKMSKDYEILRNRSEELKQANERNEILVKQNEDLIKNNCSSEEFRNEEQAKNFYDVVLELDSINKLFKSGWKISYNEKRKNIYEKIITEKTLKIGVLGLNNVGKSFILGLLTGVTIPTGYSVETKGISIKYTEGEEDSDSGICLIDSAGFETPLLEEEVKEPKEDKPDINEMEKNLKYMEKLNEISKDKGQIERFIEELIISLSDMIIVVVGKLTRREQNLISRIKSLFKDKENVQDKYIMIIHNLAQYNEKVEVEKHINNILKKSATFKIQENKVIGKKDFKERIFYSEEDGTNHYIIARQGSPAGNEYNDLTINLIKDKYNECKQRRKIDIPKEIINLFSKLSKDIIEEDISSNSLEIKDNMIIVNHKEESKKEIQKYQQAYIDAMGNYNSISVKFNPKYSYYAYKEKDKNILLFRLEIPGKIDNLTAKFQYYWKKKVIVIKGLKSKDEFPERNKKGFLTIKDNRNYENISYYLEIEQDIELVKVKPIEDTGIYEFNFNKMNRSQNKEEEDDEEDDDEDDDEEEKENKEKEKANDTNNKIIKIASGVYILKFLISEPSMIKLRKKYKEKTKISVK